MNTTSLKHQLEAFNNGNIIDHHGVEDLRCYNFYDWFCKDSSLKAKSEKLFKEVRRFVRVFKIDLDKHYVFFKNNCPGRGSLYDDFRICDIESDDVIWTVTPKSGHSFEAEIWGSRNGFKEAIYVDANLGKIYKRLA
jgi:hypothetical protein